VLTAKWKGPSTSTAIFLPASSNADRRFIVAVCQTAGLA
jgi:hypothetical protein